MNLKDLAIIWGIIIILLLLFVAIYPLKQPRCYRLVIICSRVVISDDQCVCGHRDTKGGVEFIKCDGTHGEPWRFIQGDCYAAMGEECE